MGVISNTIGLFEWPQNNMFCLISDTISTPENTSHWGNIVLMLVHRLRCWFNIKTPLPQCLLFAEIHVCVYRPLGYKMLYFPLCEVADATSNCRWSHKGWNLISVVISWQFLYIIITDIMFCPESFSLWANSKVYVSVLSAFSLLYQTLLIGVQYAPEGEDGRNLLFFIIYPIIT